MANSPSQSPVPEGEFYSKLYVQHGVPQSDSERLRKRIAAKFDAIHGGLNCTELAEQLRTETGFDKVELRYAANFSHFFKSVHIHDVFTAITLIWRAATKADRYRAYDTPPGGWARDWHSFVERAFAEENVQYRVDSKCGIHPRIDDEFERSRVSVIACLESARYAAVRHAVEESFDYLGAMPMDGKAAARSMFEAAEALTKTVTGAGGSLDEGFVNKELRPLCDHIFESDAQLKMMTGRLLSSFAKWVDAVQPYRHGHERDQPLTLPPDVAVLVVSEGAGFLRWLVSIDQRK